MLLQLVDTDESYRNIYDILKVQEGLWVDVSDEDVLDLISFCNTSYDYRLVIYQEPLSIQNFIERGREIKKKNELLQQQRIEAAARRAEKRARTIKEKEAKRIAQEAAEVKARYEALREKGLV